MSLERARSGFNVFKVHDDVDFNRVGKSIHMRGRDGTNSSTDSVEANLLYEILKVLKSQRSK
jgi:hypothetical protein